MEFEVREQSSHMKGRYKCVCNEPAIIQYVLLSVTSFLWKRLDGSNKIGFYCSFSYDLSRWAAVSVSAVKMGFEIKLLRYEQSRLRSQACFFQHHTTCRDLGQMIGCEENGGSDSKKKFT